MSFAPAQIQRDIHLVGAKKQRTHNRTIQRIYKNWTPEDLAVLERKGPRYRARMVSMVGFDYTDVVYATSLLLLHYSAAYHERGKPWHQELQQIYRRRNRR